MCEPASKSGRVARPHSGRLHLTGNATPPANEKREDPHGRSWGRTAREFAHFTGYWLPQIADRSGQWQADWSAAQVPCHFKRGEALPTLAEHIPPGNGTVAWYCRGPDACAWGMQAEGQLEWVLVEPGAWPMVLPA